jgi:amidophosphoribosyltransferase
VQGEASLIHEECGVFGIFGPEGTEAAAATYYGLFSLQHRGQESCGIAVNHQGDVHVYKDMGLVSDVFSQPVLDSLVGKSAIGHVRYSTTGQSVRENAQPLVTRYSKGTLAIAHNGIFPILSRCASSWKTRVPFSRRPLIRKSWPI